MTSPFESAGIWLKCALHIHTTESDGCWTPQETADRYRAEGFDILVITDHGKVTPVDGLSDDQMLVLAGEELHPIGLRGITYHLLAVGMKEQVVTDSLSPQETIDCARAQGAAVFKAHPVWCGLTSAEVNELDDLAGIEVWNATCLRHGKASSETLWDELLDVGRMLPAIATDDCHGPAEYFRGDFCKGWTMVKARERSREALVAALETGSFYATTGPLIEDFKLVESAEAASGWRAEASFSRAHAVGFISNAWAGRRYESLDGQDPFISFSHDVRASAEYVRLTVEDQEGGVAWSGAISVPSRPEDAKVE